MKQNKTQRNVSKGIQIENLVIRQRGNAVVIINRDDSRKHWTLYFTDEYVDFHETLQPEGIKKACWRLKFNDLENVLEKLFYNLINNHLETLVQICIPINDSSYKDWVVRPVKLKKAEEFLSNIPERGSRGAIKITENYFKLENFIILYPPILLPNIMKYGDFTFAYVVNPPSWEKLWKLPGEDKYLFREVKEVEKQVGQNLLKQIVKLGKKKGNFSNFV
jgi:hypothetical protein